MIPPERLVARRRHYRSTTTSASTRQQNTRSDTPMDANTRSRVLKRKSPIVLVYTIVLAVLFLSLAQAQPEAQAACNPHPKKALASNRAEIVGAQTNPLCLPSKTLWHHWGLGTDTRYVGGVLYKQIPFVWSWYDVDDFCRDYHYYQGTVLFVNEATLRSQAWLTAEETGEIAATIANCAPWARLVGPNHHPTIATSPADWMDRFLATYKAHGGDVDRIVANGFHVYPNNAMPGLWASEQIDAYYGLLPAELRSKPVWITEMGHANHWGPDAYAGSKELFSDVLNHPKVVWAFGYSARDYGQNMGFQESSGALTEVGRGFRDAR